MHPCFFWFPILNIFKRCGGGKKGISWEVSTSGDSCWAEPLSSPCVPESLWLKKWSCLYEYYLTTTVFFLSVIRHIDLLYKMVMELVNMVSGCKTNDLLLQKFPSNCVSMTKRYVSHFASFTFLPSSSLTHHFLLLLHLSKTVKCSLALSLCESLD